VNKLDITAVLLLLLLILIAYIVFSLPLFLGLLIMGRPHPILKVGLVTLLAMVINAAVLALFDAFMGPFAFLVTTLITVFFYREMFHIKAWKAFFVYILQIVFSGVIYFVALTLGLSVVVLSFLPFI